jgi:hypothetical protein|tara:strand:- start:716 stop:1303 length:588 start_codon:yes stop_codon:yes gene_type:complete
MSGIIQATNLQVDNIKHSGGTSSATIASDGRFTKKCYAFRALKHTATDWTSGGGTNNAVTFNNISTDSAFNSGFDLSTIGTTGKVTFPVNGIYRISATFLVNSNNSASNTYNTVVMNNTVGTTGINATTLTNDYTSVPLNSWQLVKLNTICKGTTSDYFCITKDDTLKYWGAGTSPSSNPQWGYNQVTCELIGTD